MVTFSLNTAPAPPADTEPIRNLQAKRPGQDPLDSIINPYYITMWGPRELQNAVAPMSKNRVVVSRYYPMVKPQVAVDFQSNTHWLPDAKRRWFHSRGMVYVPIYTNERLNVKTFKERLQQETQALESAGKPTEPTTEQPTGRLLDNLPPPDPNQGTTAPDLGTIEPVQVVDPNVAKLFQEPEVVVLLVDKATTMAKSENKAASTLAKRTETYRVQLERDLFDVLKQDGTPLTVDFVKSWVEKL